MPYTTARHAGPAVLKTAALYREGLSRDEIARELGCTRRIVNDRIHVARSAGHLPPPESRQTRLEQVRDRIERGATVADIAADLGLTPSRAASLCSEARARYALGPARAAPNDGHERMARLQRKGAAPPPGTMRDILTALDVAEVDALLRLLKPEDQSLAHGIARVVKAYLHDS